MRPFAITTIELTMTPLQAGAYYEVHEECAAGLNLRFESDEQGVGQARINHLKHRPLWIATLTRAFDAAPERTTVKQLETEPLHALRSP